MTANSQLNSTERQYLCEVLRSFVDRTPSPMVPTPIRWDRLHWVLDTNRLIPIFLSALGQENLDASGAPDTLLDLWRQRADGIARRNRRGARAAVETTSFLAKAGIPCMVMRGVSLDIRAYAGDQMLRRMSDVDLVVPKDRADDLVAHFSKTSPYPFTRSHNQVNCEVDGYEIEIHWNIIKRLFSFALDFNPLLEESETLVTEWVSSRSSLRRMNSSSSCPTIFSTTTWTSF